jgi:pimeloyl-ACP methyl ester carboxylesterase
VRYAYLHGFGSGPRSKKAARLLRDFAAAGATLVIPDLNRPSFERLSPSAQLAAVDELDLTVRAEARGGVPDALGLIGSSLGGWIAARWTQLHPERVDRLVLLCPGFDLARRWPTVVGGPAELERWKREGSRPFADGDGVMRPVHWGFYEEASVQPPFPEVACPTLIFHGRRDEVVPIGSSREYASRLPNVRLVELEDGHDLLASLDRVAAQTMSFFDLS